MVCELNLEEIFYGLVPAIEDAFHVLRFREVNRHINGLEP